jgi:tetratricopeptide (TPR) repeat protein
VWPPAVAPELPDRDPIRSAIDRAWLLPSKSLVERVERTQRAGLAMGLRNLDGPARALLASHELGTAAVRARHAVQLAPDLPAAHAALAAAKLEAGDLRGGIQSLSEALAAIPRHLDARAWATVAWQQALGFGALAWAALFLGLGAAASMPSLIHALGAPRLKLAGPAALAALGAVVMACALVEGPAGALLGLGAVAVAIGPATKRICAAIVAAAALVALHPGFDRLASGQLALANDPVAVAAQRIEAGIPTAAEIGVALAAAETDPLAARAIALHAKRAGDPVAAADYFAHAIATQPDAEVLNNAANVAFALGDTKGAIALYERSTALEATPIGFYNLSQALGRAVRLDEQDRALARAQNLDPQAVERITGQASGTTAVLVADAALSAGAVFARADASGAHLRLAAAQRERFAPGQLGASLGSAFVVLGAVFAAAIAAGAALTRGAGPRDFYADLARTLQAAVSDSTQRIAQLTRLRRQRARTERLLTVIALIVPGAAGLRFGRPILALFASLAFAASIGIAAASVVAAPDPLALGVLPRLASQFAAVGLVALYGLATALAFVLRAEE